MQLKKSLGLVQLLFYSIGVIIGAGVYSVIGSAAGLADQSLWLSFAVGAGVALLTGLSYAEMTTAFPHAGAEYIYVGRTFPDAGWAAFGVGTIILFGGAVTATTVAVAFGGYLNSLIDVPVVASAFVLLVACTAFNIWGLRESSWVNILFTVVEIAGLALAIAAGLTKDGLMEPLALAPHTGTMAGAAILFFVYLGFEEIANLAEEVRKPDRDLPLAIFLSIAITTVLYIAVALAVVALLPPAELAASPAPLAHAVETVWPGAGKALSGIALFATANTVLITLIATSRLAFSMARDGEIPRTFARLLPGRQTPWVAALLTFAIAAAFLPFGDVGFLAGLSSFAALLAFFAVNVALIALRYRLPRQKRPFMVPGRIGKMPVIPVLAIFSIALLLAHFERDIYIAGAVALAASGLAFLLRHWSRSTKR